LRFVDVADDSDDELITCNEIANLDLDLNEATKTRFVCGSTLACVLGSASNAI
jgi:hypothetical protein